MESSRFATRMTIVGTLLTALLLVTSYFQLTAAKLQAKAAIVTLMPNIEVRPVYGSSEPDVFTLTCGIHPSAAASAQAHVGPPPCYFASEAELPRRQHLRLSSDGGPIYNIDVDSLTWFSVRAHANNKIVHRQQILDYYPHPYGTGRVRGDIYWLLSTADNVSNQHKLYALLQKHLIKQAYVEFVQTLVKVAYTDTLQSRNVEYFLVTSSEGVTRLDSANGGSQWKSLSEEFAGKKWFILDFVTEPSRVQELVSIVQAKLRP